MDHRLNPDRSEDRRRWRSHHLISGALRLIVLLGPGILSVLVVLAGIRLLRIPDRAERGAIWWAVLAAAVLLAWMLSSRLLERLLPLAALLDLTLLFPDAAPSRFAVLRRQAGGRHLESQLRRVRETSGDAPPAKRAQTILELAAALSVHDPRTRGHSERVRMFTDLLAEELHLRRSEADRLRWAALLHDIGKLSVPASILNKAGKPDSAEWTVLRRHPDEGHLLTAPLHAWLGPWALAVREHHERFDGHGYPNQLRGGGISLGGRIVAVADSYETMTAARPYKPPMTVRAAREELVRMSGAHFDPVVVRAFLNISLGKLWRTVGFTALLAEIPLLGRFGGRLPSLSPRLASAITTTAAAGSVVVVGLALAPAAVLPLPPNAGQPVAIPATPSSNSPLALPASDQPPGRAPQPVAGPPAASAPASGVSGPAPSAGAAQSGSGSAAGRPAYPAGVQKQSRLPAGIAKNPGAFSGWRRSH